MGFLRMQSLEGKTDIDVYWTTFWALSIATFCSRFEILVIFTKIDHKGKSSTQIEVLASFFAHRDIFWCSKWWHTQFRPMLKVLYSTWRQPISANSTQIALKSRWSLQCEYVFSNLTCAEFCPENDETSAEAQKHRKRGVNHLFLSTAKTEISQFWTFHQSIAEISGFRHARSLQLTQGSQQPFQSSKLSHLGQSNVGFLKFKILPPLEWPLLTKTYVSRDYAVCLARNSLTIF